MAAQDNSHGGFYIFVTAFPCPVRYLVGGKVYFFCPALVGEALEPPATRYDLAGWSRADVGIRPYKGIRFCVWNSPGDGFFGALRLLRMTEEWGKPILSPSS